jgi:hypothetical protein
MVKGMEVYQFNNISLPFFYFFYMFSYGFQWFIIIHVNIKFDFII